MSVFLAQHTARLLWFIVPLALLSGMRGPDSPERVVPARQRVVARATGPGGATGSVRHIRATIQGEPLAVDERKFKSGVRHAICPPGGASFRTRVDVPVERLRMSLASSRAETSWSVRTRMADEDWQTVLSVPRLPATGTWHDRIVPLPTGTTEVEFEITSPARGDESCWGGLVFTAQARDAPPNVLVMSLDTLGADYLEPSAGAARRLSHFEALRAQSFVFDRAYTPFPSTYSAHSSLFSGLYPFRHGRYTGTPRGLTSLVSRFAENGYLTIGITENGFVGSSFGFAQGFDA